MTTRRTILVAAVVAAAAACNEPTRPEATIHSRATLSSDAGPGARIVVSLLSCGYGSGGGASEAGCDAAGWWGWSANLFTLAEGDTGWTGGTPGSNGGADRAPAWSPDGTRIAFDRRGEITVLTVSDGATTTLTNDPAYDTDPSWSPDGARIAFSRSDYGVPDLYLMNADGSNVTRLTSGVGFAGRPAWSPDGSRIAFDCTIGTDVHDICVVNANGTELLRLTSDPGSDAGAAWSPSGERIAFSTERFGGGRRLAVMNADGSGVEMIGTGVEGSDPAWSPDGQRIAFDYVADDDVCTRSCVYMVNADGSGLTPLWPDAMRPSWAPAGVAPPPPPPLPDQPPSAQFTAACTELACQFSDGSTDDHGIVARVWTFGDGSGASNVTSASHTYATDGTYAVTLTDIDGAGQSSSVTHGVSVAAPDLPPVARFTASCTGLACTFTSDASSDDHGIASRAWSFGDGFSAGDVAAPAHTFGAAGGYAVTLTVTDTKGQSASTTQSVAVTDLPPVARFTWSCAHTICTFDGRASTDELSVASYSWTLNRQPAASATGAVVTYDYKKAGSYAVTLIVRDPAGHASTFSSTVAVTR